MPVLVRDVMTRTPVTVEGNARLLDALALMLDRNVKSAVVPPRHENDAFGIVTFYDVAAAVVAGEEQVEMLNVYDVMTKPAVGVHEHWEIKYAARFMTGMNIQRAIVTDGKVLQGIVSMTDIVRSLLRRPGTQEG